MEEIKTVCSRGLSGMKNKASLKKLIIFSSVALGATFVGLSIVSQKKKSSSIYENEPDQKNPMEGKKVIFVEDENDSENADGVRGHLEAVGEASHVPGIYEKYIKRGIDIVLSFGGLVLLSPVMGAVALAIKIEDPGPVLFTQKRLGQNKKYFKLHKFRSMKMDTPHDVPTHMLDNPDQYITRVGKFIRRKSIDELPQVWDIFVGNMSIIGPRPGLWNQDLLTAERDKYGANDVKPGLTGWAQINGRDELEIPDKAKLDGEYVKKMGIGMDTKVFLGSVHVFGKDDSVVEGGTGEIKKAVSRHYTDGKSDEQLIGHIGFGERVEVDVDTEKKVLITGAGSYIGESFRVYAQKNYPALKVDAVDMLDSAWRETDFSEYDIVYHVAGIAHADVGNVDEATKAKYYTVNTDLAVEVCEKAKAEGVKEFVFMSSMIVYGDSASYGKNKVIDESTVPVAANFYGDSKLQADVAVRSLATDSFKVIVLRPPMIYGKGSKGNYPTLAKLAKKFPVFPDVDNERSMLHIDNLCEFLCQIMLIKEIKENAIVLIPQNAEWTKTTDMVKEIAAVSGKRIITSRIMKPVVLFASNIPGKVGGLVNKAFGNNCYAHEISVYTGVKYQSVNLNESIKRTESRECLDEEEHMFEWNNKPKALIIASVASMIDQFNMQNIQLLLDNGYHVEVACNCKEGNTISDERIQNLIDGLAAKDVPTIHVPIPRKISDVNGIKMSLSQVKKMCDENQYDLLHCHSPIGSVVARLAARDARKKGTKVIYTAHGFHFYKGAPKKNWIMFYPIEKICSTFTDVLITINREDYEFSKKHMNTERIEYIPGVGIDTKKFILENFDKATKRRELGIADADFMIISVGELNENKNQEVVIRAIAKMKKDNIHYFIAGKGDKEKYLIDLARRLGVNLHLLGYRTDIVELLNTADLYVFPSKREGLSVALMEAMAAGLPCVASKIRGNVDLIDEGKGGYLFDPTDVDGFVKGIKSYVKSMGTYNQTKIKDFDVNYVINKISKIYFDREKES